MDNPCKAPFQLHDALTYKLYKLNKRTDRESQTAYLGKAGLPLSEARCLAAIGSFAPLSVQELASSANLHAGQASRAAQTLLRKGLITKIPSTVDARVLCIALTKQGKQVLRSVVSVIEQRNEEIFNCLSIVERKNFSEILDKLLANIPQ